MIALSPEAQFVLLSTREADTVATSTLLSSAGAVRDWDGLAEAAMQHGVTSYVLDAAQRTELPLPSPASASLRGAMMAAVAHGMLLDHALERISAGLLAADVPMIVLKGPGLARTIYAQPRLRPYNDLDLTVREEHEARAVAALSACGFTEVPYAAEEARRAHAGHAHDEAAFHRIFVSNDWRRTVELHLDPLQLGLRPTAEAARWRRAVDVPGLSGALMLCPEDQIVQLSVHAQKHGFSRLIWLKDLDLLLRTYGDRLDWDLVRCVAAQEGVAASVWYSLGLACLTLGAPVSRQVLTMLRPSPPERVLYRLVWPPARIANLGGYMRRRAVQFHAAESWRGTLPSLLLMGRRRQRLCALVHALFPGR
jgi:hypothetical protein